MTFRLGTTPALAPELGSILSAPGDRSILGQRDSDEALLAALRAGDVDAVAVPAATMSAEAAAELRVAAVPRRQEPRDVLAPATPLPLTLGTLPRGGRVGVWGARRLALLAVHRPDVEARAIANGHTPASLLGSGRVDALILGSAEARRAGLAEAASEVLPAKTWLPAPAQGAVALLARPGDAAAVARLAHLHHAPSHAALRAERALVRELGVTRDGPLAALALPYGRWLRLWAMVASARGRRVVRADVSGPDDAPEELAHRVAELLRGRGVERLLP